MTREEAIEQLNNVRDLISEEAIDMAIEALEQEETLQNLTKPNKSDLISRQAAIDALKEHRALYCDNTPETFSKLSYAEKSRVDELDAAIATLVNLPSAQLFTEEQIQTMQELESAQIEKAYELGKADRPTGHWIENAQEYYEMINEKGGGVDENTPYFTDDIACSECLAKFSVIDNETERFDFCPNCGCSMKGADDE